MAIWIVSDWHFCHNKEFLYKPRGFGSIEEMNKEIIRRHNALVAPDDTVYCLGDCGLGGTDSLDEVKSYIEALNGRIIVTTGNHDTARRIDMYETCKNVQEVYMHATTLRYRKYTFYLSHYPALTGNMDGDKPLKARVINLCGHSHCPDRWTDWDKGLIYHCELEAHNCEPVLLDDIIKEIKGKIQERIEGLESLNALASININATDLSDRIAYEFTPIVPINPAAPVLSTQARCDKCIRRWPFCGGDDSFRNCESYKRDAPDGGYYG